ncbi:hypothetical protein [Butyrivibrio sp. VCB2006]|uniref:hypothetical protein n=1 Tax=Butyrivibrio sp. VCB2006 TaxID=1280679 RepID=UPI0003F97C73|nr:hypothetical protein [Butyrivibrio sp. VCB2006]
MITRLLLRMIMIPVFCVLALVSVFLKAIEKVSSWALVIFWLVMVVAAVFIIMEKQYWQLAIVGISVAGSFAIMFAVVWIETAVGDLGELLRSKI